METRKSVIKTWIIAKEKIKSSQFEIFSHAKCQNLKTAEYEHNYSSYCPEYNNFSEEPQTFTEHEQRKLNSILHGLCLLRLDAERYEIKQQTSKM